MAVLFVLDNLKLMPVYHLFTFVEGAKMRKVKNNNKGEGSFSVRGTFRSCAARISRDRDSPAEGTLDPAQGEVKRYAPCNG